MLICRYLILASLGTFISLVLNAQESAQPSVSEASASVSVPPPPDTFTTQDALLALVDFRNRFIKHVAPGLKACSPKQQAVLADSISLDDYAVLEPLVRPPAGLDEKQHKQYVRAFVNVGREEYPLYGWNYVSKRVPGLDSANFMTCAIAFERAARAFSFDMLHSEAPYPINPQGAPLAELTALRLRPGDRVADVGAGYGQFTELLIRLDSVRLTSTELWQLDEYLLALFFELPPKQAVRLRVKRAKQKKLNLEAGRFDAVVVRNTFHHFKHPEVLAEQLRDALAPGGRLLILDTYTDLHDDLAKIMRQCPEHEAFDEHASLLAAAGLKKVRHVEVKDNWWLTEWVAGE